MLQVIEKPCFYIKHTLLIMLFVGASTVIGASSSSAESDRRAFFSNLFACFLIEDGTEDAAAEFNLSAEALSAGIESYLPDQMFSDAEIESFRWRAAIPISCSQHVDDAPRYAHYVLSEALVIFNQAAGVDLSWSDIKTRATGQACAKFLSLATPSLEDEAFAVIEDIAHSIEHHPVLGTESHPSEWEDSPAGECGSQ